MKRKIFLIFSLAFVLIACQSSIAQNQGELEIGASMPMKSTQMANTNGSTTSIASVKGNKGTVVFFWCNTCPWVSKYEQRMLDIANSYKNDFGFIAINANDPIAYPDDNMDAMKKRAADKNYSFPYVADEGSAVAYAYGAARTPHIYVFDAQDKLVYVGGVDSTPSGVTEDTEPYLKNALDAVKSGTPVPKDKTRAFGCTIKWQS